MAAKSENFKPTITISQKEKLIRLADKYETKDFLKEDPSQFLYYYNTPQDIELCSFIAALLSFGSRKQFIPKIQYIMSLADNCGGIYNWLLTHAFENEFKVSNNKKFYRFYSYRDFYYLFSKLSDIIQIEKSFGIFLHGKYVEELNNGNSEINLIDIISDYFSSCSIVPSTKTSAKKRLCMFLRWMVRPGSPVDIGLWTWYSPDALLIPLDVHVLEEAKKLKLIPPNAGGTRKTCEEITKIARTIFVNDPCKLDFALFGLGVDK
ncbi:MAG: TIGR02757 family protein [Treponema sp.]|uniref:TIGR02757 family protein n=1 Tax=Treponema sp. TaxID=166 RepID=UPI00298EB232|nr:TIGR02757 family protein [Treponema sp.]MDD5811379.1 TIGR02757 family protein [Treponema sp.]